MTTLEVILIIAILIITALSIVAIAYYDNKNSCSHKWKVVDEIVLFEESDSKIPCGRQYLNGECTVDTSVVSKQGYIKELELKFE